MCTYLVSTLRYYNAMASYAAQQLITLASLPTRPTLRLCLHLSRALLELRTCNNSTVFTAVLRNNFTTICTLKELYPKSAFGLYTVQAPLVAEHRKTSWRLPTDNLKESGN